MIERCKVHWLPDGYEIKDNPKGMFVHYADYLAALDQRNKDIADMMAKKLLGLVMPQIRETIDDLIRDFGKEE